MTTHTRVNTELRAGLFVLLVSICWALLSEQHLDSEQVEPGERSHHRAVHGRVTTEAQALPYIYGFKCFIISVSFLLIFFGSI